MRAGRRAPHGHAHVDELDLGVLVGVAVAQLVRSRERRAQRVGVERRRARLELLLDGELERLAAVAQLVADAHARRLDAERSAGLGDQRVALLAKAAARVSERCSSISVRAASRRGAAAARPSAHSTPEARGQSTRADPQPACERGRVQRAGAAERHQREAARVDPALDAHHAQRAQHLRLGDPHDALRARRHLEVELARQARDRVVRRVAVERQLARQRRVLEQPAEQEVGVGHGRLAPAASVAGGAGIGARRGRPHAQRAAGVAPGDRAAARADGVDVERRQRQRTSGDRALGGLGDLAAVDQADVAGGPAHVEAQHARLVGELGQRQRAGDAAGRAGQHGERGVCGGLSGLGEAAGGLHDLRLGQPERAGVARERPQVGGEQRRERGVERRGGRALVLAEGAHEIAGERQVRAGQQLLEQLAEQALVGGVGVGVQQRDRDRLRLGGSQLLDQLARERGLEREQRAVRSHALGNREAQLRGDERRGRARRTACTAADGSGERARSRR